MNNAGILAEVEQWYVYADILKCSLSSWAFLSASCKNGWHKTQKDWMQRTTAEKHSQYDRCVNIASKTSIGNTRKRCWRRHSSTSFGNAYMWISGAVTTTTTTIDLKVYYSYSEEASSITDQWPLKRGPHIPGNETSGTNPPPSHLDGNITVSRSSPVCLQAK